jgi:antirestriction protein
MIQDYEGFPDKFYWEGGLSEELFDWLALDENERNILEAYIAITGDEKCTIGEAMEDYMGAYSSDVDFTQELLESCGFVEPVARPLSFGIATVYTAKRPDGCGT